MFYLDKNFDNFIDFNNYFDEIYCINLTEDLDRWKSMEVVFNYLGLDVTKWAATKETLFRGYSNLLPDNNINSRYLACLNSHLSIMEDALAKGHDKIFIMEDDIIPVKNLYERFDQFIKSIPDLWDMIYLAYIRTDDAKSIWTYKNMEDLIINNCVVPAENFWSGMAYGISKPLMNFVVDWYKNNPPIEIDRFYVEKIQKAEQFKTYGSFPQMFAGVDNYSNNTLKNETIFNRSVNYNHQTKNDFLFPEDTPKIIHPNDYFDGVFCINVLESTDRWSKVSKQFDKVGLNVTQFNALTPTDSEVIDKYEKIKNNNPPILDRNSNIKTFSAFMSHMKLIKHCIDNEYERFLIFEDDIILRKDFLIEFTKCVNNYTEDTGVWLLGVFQHDWKATISINKSFYETSNSMGLFAYALTLENAKKLYRKLEEIIDLNWSIDLAIVASIMGRDGFNFRVSWPFLVGHDTIQSLTNGRTEDYTKFFPRKDYYYLD